MDNISIHDISLWLWHTLQLILSRLESQHYHFGTKAQAQAQLTPSQVWDILTLGLLKPMHSPAHH